MSSSRRGLGRTGSLKDAVLRVLLCGFLGLMAGLGHYVLVPPQYTASTLVTAHPARTPGPDSPQLESLMQVRYAQALARLAMTYQTASPALRRAGLVEMADSPRKYMTTSAAPDTAVFTLSARSTDAAEARKAVDVVAAAVADQSKARGLPVALSFDPGQTPEHPAPGMTPRLVLGFVVGLAAGFLWVLVLLDQTSTAESVAHLRAASRIRSDK